LPEMADAAPEPRDPFCHGETISGGCTNPAHDHGSKS
jgi:hypothetical protein